MELYFLAQTPWMILHGHNPFANDFLNAPMGLNVLDSTSVTFLGVLGAPITLIFGPIATYNVMLNVALAGSALAFYLMARRFVSWWPAAFVGGLIYGFSPFAYAQGASHLVWTFNVIPPLLILFLDRFFRKQGASPWLSGLAVGACFVVEFYVSAEGFATLVIFTAIAAVILGLYWWRRKPDVDVQRLLRLCACAAIVAALGTSYGAWSALHGPEHINGPEQTVQALAGLSTDPVGLVVPTLNQHFTLGAAKLRGQARLGAHGQLANRLRVSNGERDLSRRPVAPRPYRGGGCPPPPTDRSVHRAHGRDRPRALDGAAPAVRRASDGCPAPVRHLHAPARRQESDRGAAHGVLLALRRPFGGPDRRRRLHGGRGGRGQSSPPARRGSRAGSSPSWCCCRWFPPGPTHRPRPACHHGSPATPVRCRSEPTSWCTRSPTR